MPSPQDCCSVGARTSQSSTGMSTGWSACGMHVACMWHACGMHVACMCVCIACMHACVPAHCTDPLVDVGSDSLICFSKAYFATLSLCIELSIASRVYSETSDKGHSERGQTSQQRTRHLYSSIHTLYRITSGRGQPLYKGQTGGSQWCPLFRGSTV